MWRGATLMALALSCSAVQGFQVTVSNKCSESVELFHVVQGSQSMEMLAPGKSIVRTLSDGSPSNVFKKGRGGQATLAEITGGGGLVWYDISIIPTGPKSGPEYCPSLEACKALTGGVGFNAPMQIIPSKTTGGRCVTLTCMADGCGDAYQYPKDDSKTHACPGGTNLEVVFCPGGSGGATPAPTPAPTPEPTPAPTPEPSPASTPEPSPAPTSEPTPAPSSQEESGVLGSSSSASSSNGTTTSDAGTNSIASTINLAGGEDEVAGEADSVSKTSGGETSPGVIATGGNNSDRTKTTEISTQTGSTSSGTGAEVYVLSIMGGVGMVAVAAIVVVRKKKAALDAENVKTPRDRAMTTAAALMMLSTPKDNVTIL